MSGSPESVSLGLFVAEKRQLWRNESLLLHTVRWFGLRALAYGAAMCLLNSQLSPRHVFTTHTIT